MHTNLQRLGSLLDDRMKRNSNAAVKTVLEFGVINSNLSLTTDTIKTQIPKGDYMVSLTLTHINYKGYVNEGGPEPHVHRDPSVFRQLKPGDRVLVAWVGFEPVVIDIIVSSNTVTTN